jgi:hypothetical protein
MLDVAVSPLGVATTLFLQIPLTARNPTANPILWLEKNATEGQSKLKAPPLLTTCDISTKPPPTGECTSN